MPFGMTSQGIAMFSTFKQKLEAFEDQERRALKGTFQKEHQSVLQKIAPDEKAERLNLQEAQIRKNLQELPGEEGKRRQILQQRFNQDYAQMSQDIRDQFTRTLPVASLVIPPLSGAVPRPAVSDIVIPEIAKGYEDIYRRFVMGNLIYKPDSNSDNGLIELPIRDLADPLGGEFDLSRCGGGTYLSIATGYRKEKKQKNDSKLEIWLAPRFLIEKELATTAGHFQPIMENWNAAAAPVGLFWTDGDWDNLGWYAYLTTDSLNHLDSGNLDEKYLEADGTRLDDSEIVEFSVRGLCSGMANARRRVRSFKFHF